MDRMIENCLVMNTIMAARVLTRRMDRALKPHGVSVIQFSVLMVLHWHPDEPVSRMADRIMMERTTLIRNLEVMVRKGLVAASPAESGGGRDFSLTEEGRRVAQALIDGWPEAQASMRALLPKGEPERYLASLRALAAG